MNDAPGLVASVAPARWPESDSEPAITQKKVLAKICFAKYGEAIEPMRAEFMGDLYRYLRKMPEKPITYQTIRHWFYGKDAAPARVNALIFLKSYILNEVMQGNYEVASIEDAERIASRKKVKRQLLRYLDGKISTEISSASQRDMSGRMSGIKDLSVFMSNMGRINIDLGMEEMDLQESAAEQITGIYTTYRERSVYAGERHISREVVHIFKKGSETRFRHWYIHEGTELSRFEGVVVLMGSAFWLFGSSRSGRNRFVVMQIRHIVSTSRRYRSLRWGLMLTDVPSVLSRDPLASRILFYRMIADEVVNIDEAISREVRNITEAEIEDRHREIFLRLISNQTTASSSPGSTKEAVGADGSIVKDRVLKVSQETLESAISEVL